MWTLNVYRGSELVARFNEPFYKDAISRNVNELNKGFQTRLFEQENAHHISFDKREVK